MASSIGAVETLKDQLGICRWNYVLRSLHQHLKNNTTSYTEAKDKLFSTSSSAVVSKSKVKKRTKEDCMAKVMELSCWGPNTTRF